MLKYILEGKIPKPIADVVEWRKQFEKADRIVATTILPYKGLNIEVSTVFLGIDHNFSGGVPILFETMIFGGKYDDYQEQYATWEEAEAGHKRAIELVKGEET